MLTLQDLWAVGQNESNRIQFCLQLISAHKDSEEYKTAVIAKDYDRQRNTTIMNYRKFLYNLQGKPVPDIFSANYRLPSNFFNSFVTQQNQYLLGNGMSLTNDEKDNDRAQIEKAKLGKDFDSRLQLLGRNALVQAVSFGFWNYDHLDVFELTEFAPLYDEETGALGAGVRFWQLAENKPLRFTLYEQDGYTEYCRRTTEAVDKDGNHLKVVEVVQEKRAYKLITQETDKDGVEIVAGENYNGFPIVPLWGNPNKQSSIIGIREKIDCYDLIESGFANDLDDTSSIYWVLHNTGGMNDMDLAQFVERMKTIRAAVVDSDSGVGAEAHTIEVPYQARQAYLEILENGMYKDFCIVNVSNISAGNKTATEIVAAYQPMDTKVDQYEFCVLDFLSRLFELVGVDGYPIFKRNRIVNQAEETEMVLQAAQFLDKETLLRHLPWLTPDEVDALLQGDDEMEQLDVDETPVIEEEI